ncbi:MAG: RluA family pseudouridine synthase [Rhodospirillales bacterium]|nr:RluA family pseudouridine synthase [Rhodospirillales bacterium]MCB9995001.1 RluA family pseudouridine synthase [Rhodospirillales bacterium]
MLSCAIGPADHGARLDKALAVHCEGLSRSRLKALILDGAVMLDDVPCTDPSIKVKDGMTVTVAVPPPVADEPEPENIPLDIVFEDECMLVINKQAGLVVHPGAGNWQGTMVNALLYHCGDSLSGIGGVRRPGIVHRLDKDTSGLMVVAKTDEAHQALSAQLSDRTLGRYYTALVWGVPSPPKGSIDQPIGRHPSSRLKMAVTSKNSREARTHYTVQDSYGGAASMTECKLDSGRTHQVRVHMAYLRHPLIGDPLYGLQRTAAAALLRKSGTGEDVAEQLLSFPRQALHAWKIGFVHPRTQEAMMFESCLPDDMAEILNHLKTIS